MPSCAGSSFATSSMWSTTAWHGAPSSLFPHPTTSMVKTTHRMPRRYAIVPPMSIRPARDDDFAAIAAITNHYIATTAIHFAYEPLSADDIAAYTRDDRFPWFVVDEGRVIGYAKAGTWRD